MGRFLGILIGIAMLVGMWYVMWSYKWYILSGVLVATLTLMGSNAVYHRVTGKDMPLYTRIMKD